MRYNDELPPIQDDTFMCMYTMYDMNDERHVKHVMIELPIDGMETAYTDSNIKIFDIKIDTVIGITYRIADADVRLKIGDEICTLRGIPST